MSSPSPCPSLMVPASLPADFALLCRSVLARDPIYGRLMNEEATPVYDGLSAMRFQYEQENTPFVLGPRVLAEKLSHQS